jgi:drug/metabolite transporter (DMT)-like permease
MRNAGELAALLTAMCWTVTALAFEASSKKVGSMVVNLFRLIAGFFFLSIFCWIYRGYILPVDASGRTWFILIISGLIGFTFGDLCLLQAFVIVGARISMLLMALAPPITALIGWLFLGETMTLKSLAGMSLTLTGIAIVVLKRPAEPDEDEPQKKKVRFSYPIWGILLGLGGAIGQATGLVLSKSGMHGYDPFASAQIRVIAGIGGFVIIYAFWNVWKTAYRALSNRTAMIQLSVGAFFGPFLGVSFSLLAVQLTSTGIASTIMAMVPVLIIPPSFLIFREKVTFKEILGAVLAVGGVALFFL